MSWGSVLLEFLRRLFAKSNASRTFVDRLHGNGTFDVEVVSKSDDWQNLELFWRATSDQWERRDLPDGGDCFERSTYVQLVPNDSNRNNPYAIDVEVAGRKAGYLSSHDALRIHRRLNQLGYDRINAPCKASISGGRGYWVVRLDLVDELITQAPEEGKPSH